ncbi:MAG: hypothetical protein ABMA14_09555 [Hyphomonadaceae bacterium]
MRDQILADCARRLLAGETLGAESDFVPSTDPPADYGGPCPRTPYDMNRRFLAIARFNADPEAAILEHVRRIAKRARIDPANSVAAHGSTDATLLTMSSWARSRPMSQQAHLRSSCAARAACVRRRTSAAPSMPAGRR